MSKITQKLLVLLLFLLCFSLLSMKDSVEAGAGIIGVQLTDGELNELRGGVGSGATGFAFGINFSGSFPGGEIGGNLLFDGNIVKDPNFKLPAGDPTGVIEGSGANIQAYVGNFEGASGIFQIVQSPGSHNIINNNLLLQVTMVTVSNAAQLDSISKALPWK
jgi:hypothetical protein